MFNYIYFMNDVELIQSFCTRYINKLVKEHFKDIENLEINDNLDLTNARQISRKVCYHKDKDPISLTTCRLIIFYFVMSGLKTNLDEIFYTIPSTEFHESVKFRPQVVLIFKESLESAKKRKTYPTRARISYRLKDEDLKYNNEELSERNAKKIAQEIKNKLATPIFKFKKGRKKYSYIDVPKGYRFILAVEDKVEAKRVIKQVMSIQKDTPDWELLSESGNSDKDWDKKEKKKILGETVEMPTQRPVATVNFHHAELKIHGMTRDKCLVDTSGTYRDAYEYVV